MNRQRFALIVAAAATAIVVSLHAKQTPAQKPGEPDPSFRFRSGVELINVTATVSDASGRFVSGLTEDDFIVYDDDQRVEVTHFSAERVPVSLGIALDTSGSMNGAKMSAARGAIARFVNDLLEMNDELFLYRFSNYPVLVQGWTHDRRDLLDPLARLVPNGATALYDAVARAVPLAKQGQNRKKALVVISDGNDTSSRTDILDLKQQIRESEVLVYAVGIDGDSDRSGRRAPIPPPVRLPTPGAASRRSSRRRMATTAAPAPAAGRAAAGPPIPTIEVTAFARGAVTWRISAEDAQKQLSTTEERRTRRIRRGRPAQQARMSGFSSTSSASSAVLVTPRPPFLRGRDFSRPRGGEADPTLECRVPLLGVALALSIFGSCGGLLVASSLLLFTQRIRTRLIPWLVSYAVGALLGVALLALLPDSRRCRRPPCSARCWPAS
jgi:Mg-chelatase subunit ChlD